MTKLFWAVAAACAVATGGALADGGEAQPGLLAGVDEAQLLATVQVLLVALIDRAGAAEIVIAAVSVLWLIRHPLARLTPTRRDDDALVRLDGALATAGLEPVPLLQKLLRWFRVGRGAR